MPEKLMDCVRDVKAQGKSEDSAWPICVASTGQHPHKHKKKVEKSNDIEKAWVEYTKAAKLCQRCGYESAEPGSGFCKQCNAHLAVHGVDASEDDMNKAKDSIETETDKSEKANMLAATKKMSSQQAEISDPIEKAWNDYEKSRMEESNPNKKPKVDKKLKPWQKK